MSGPLRVTAAVLAALVVLLHYPVFTRGALVTPAGGQYGLWPWKAYGAAAVKGGALIEHNATLSDLLFQVYPWQLYTARSLQGGWIPLWNPYSYCGAPFVANAQSAIFYPLHWPAWIVPSMRVFTAAILMKIVLAGLFMAIFLRGLGCRASACVTGSVSFALCGFMTSWLGYAHTNAAVLLPLIMHAARLLAASPSTGGFLLLAFAAAAQYLGGHPETSLHIVGASSLYFLWCLWDSARRRAALALYVGGSLLGFALSAVQMLPFLGYLRVSAALAQRRLLPGMDPTLPAGAPLALLLPGWFGRAADGSYQADVPWQAIAVYAGAGVLLAAMVSLRWFTRARFFAALALCSAVVVYGPPAVRAALAGLPLVGISSNNRLLLIVSFSLATLAALGIEGFARLAADPAARARERAGLLFATGALAATLACAALLLPSRDPAGSRLAAFFVGGTALFLALALLRPSSRGVYLAGVAAIACVDMLQFAWGFNPHADPDALFPPTGLTDFLRRDASVDMVRGGRLMTVGWTMRPETQMPYWLSSIEGYDAMELADYRHLLDRARVAHVHETGEIPDGSRALLDLLGTRYFVAPPGGVVSGEGLSVVYDGADGRVFVNERARPRFSFVARASYSDPRAREAVLEDLAAGRIDLDRAVSLESQRGTSETGAPLTRAPVIRLLRNRAGSLLLSLQGHDAPGWIVVRDAYDTGWRATVNGEPAEVERADYLFMSVKVPAGEAAVDLAYRPASFRAGVWISAVSLLFAIVTGLVSLAAARGEASGAGGDLARDRLQADGGVW